MLKANVVSKREFYRHINENMIVQEMNFWANILYNCSNNESGYMLIPTTFHCLCCIIAPSLVRAPTRTRSCILNETRVTIAFPQLGASYKCVVKFIEWLEALVL